MDSSELTKNKRNRVTANSLSGGGIARPHSNITMNTQVLSSYRLGSRLVSHNKRLVLPFCQPPLCDTDLGTEPPVGELQVFTSFDAAEWDNTPYAGKRFNPIHITDNGMDRIYIVNYDTNAPPQPLGGVSPYDIFSFDIVGTTLTNPQLLYTFNYYFTYVDQTGPGIFYGPFFSASGIKYNNGKIYFFDSDPPASAINLRLMESTAGISNNYSNYYVNVVELDPITFNATYLPLRFFSPTASIVTLNTLDLSEVSLAVYNGKIYFSDYEQTPNLNYDPSDPGLSPAPYDPLLPLQIPSPTSGNNNRTIQLIEYASSTLSYPYLTTLLSQPKGARIYAIDTTVRSWGQIGTIPATINGIAVFFLNNIGPNCDIRLCLDYLQFPYGPIYDDSVAGGALDNVGNSVGSLARFRNMRGIGVIPSGNSLLVSDFNNYEIKEVGITPPITNPYDSDSVTLYAGGGTNPGMVNPPGTGAAGVQGTTNGLALGVSTFRNPEELTVLNASNVYVIDLVSPNNRSIRLIKLIP